MANHCPVGFDTGSLRDQVRATYERVARNPDGDFHFHRGPQYAARYLDYDAAELAALPETATARFAGVGNPLALTRDPAIGPLVPGQVVLDHACGAGTDLLLAARRVAPNGRAIGVDMTPGMRECAARAAEQAGLGEVIDIRAGVYEELPVEDASVDVVISNGVVNLAPDKSRVFREIARVLKPGGRLLLADVIVQRELNLTARSNPDLWAACIGGALVEGELTELAAAAGLAGGRIVQRFNCFMGTSAEDKVSRDLFVHGVNFHATKEGK
jgi:ubiquinone/menaquinone biosynthesis C-methylase UbiE